VIFLELDTVAPDKREHIIALSVARIAQVFFLFLIHDFKQLQCKKLAEKQESLICHFDYLEYEDCLERDPNVTFHREDHLDHVEYSGGGDHVVIIADYAD
jgi:hypothetical protein